MLTLLLVSLSAIRQKRARIECDNNLKQIALGLRLSATNQHGLFPMQVGTNRDGSPLIPKGGAAEYWIQTMGRGVKPKILVCPSDTRRPARSLAELKNDNISYFMGLDIDETRPLMLLAGDRNLTVNRVPVKSGLLIVTTNDMLGMTEKLHGDSVNIALVDGSVQIVGRARLKVFSAGFGNITNHLLIP